LSNPDLLYVFYRKQSTECRSYACTGRCGRTCCGASCHGYRACRCAVFDSRTAGIDAKNFNKSKRSFLFSWKTSAGGNQREAGAHGSVTPADDGGYPADCD
jgi:hypothetical protein